MQKNIDEGRVEFIKQSDGSWIPYEKIYAPLEGEEKTKKYVTWIDDVSNGTETIKSLFGQAVFDYAKSTELISRFLKMANVEEDDTILDFFSGSATTAHAVMQLNTEDAGSRKFIMVQYPETTGNADYPTICEIGKERIRRAGDKLTSATVQQKLQDVTSGHIDQKLDGGTSGHTVQKSSGGTCDRSGHKLDVGFKVFRVADTNIRWTHEALKGGQMELDESMLSDKEKLDFMPGFNDLDVVYEILLRQRDIPLSAKVEKLGIGKRTYLFADAYVVCLDDDVTREMVEGLAAIEPTPIKYVLRDSAFGDDITLKDETIRRLEAYIARNNGDQKKTYTVEMI